MLTPESELCTLTRSSVDSVTYAHAISFRNLFHVLTHSTFNPHLYRIRMLTEGTKS